MRQQKVKGKRTTKHKEQNDKEVIAKLEKKGK